MDFEGLRLFAGHGLERLNTERPRDRVVDSVHRAPSPQLFSDLNEWMLKVLLAPSIPERYLAAPRGRYQGASQLAKAAAVSEMTAFRFIQQFSKAGFLEEGRERIASRANRRTDEPLAGGKPEECARNWGSLGASRKEKRTLRRATLIRLV